MLACSQWQSQRYLYTRVVESANYLWLSKIYAVTHQAGNKPVIVFVPTRKQTRTTAKDLITFVDTAEDAKTRRFLHCAADDLAPHLKCIQYNIIVPKKKQRNNLFFDWKKDIESKALQESLGYGVGFYHDGLTGSEKRVVETLFTTGAIQVIKLNSWFE